MSQSIARAWLLPCRPGTPSQDKKQLAAVDETCRQQQMFKGQAQIGSVSQAGLLFLQT